MAKPKYLQLRPEFKQKTIKALNKANLVESITRFHGSLSDIAREFGSHPLEVLKRIETVGLKTFLHKVISQYKETMIEASEKRLFDLAIKGDPKIALDACKYILSGIGKRRGWGAAELEKAARSFNELQEIISQHTKLGSSQATANKNEQEIEEAEIVKISVK